MTEGVNRKGKPGWPKGKKRDPRVHVGMSKPAGSHNPKRELYEDIIVKALAGEHPLQALARIARESELEGDRTLAATCYKELSNYCAPKLKAVEIKQNEDNYKPITIVVSDEGKQEVEHEVRRLANEQNEKVRELGVKGAMVEAVLVDD